MATSPKPQDSSAGEHSEQALSLLAGCDEEQASAITSTLSPLLVLAGAGSGKTRVLTRRVAWRIFEQDAEAGHVLVLTFTRKASAELKERLTSLGLPEKVTAGTFHAIALAELRRLASEKGKSPPVVLASKARLIHDVLKSSHLPAPRQLARGARSRRPTERPIHDVAGEIEWAKARLVAPADYGEQASAAGRHANLDPRYIEAAFKGYESERAKRGLVDFEDLLTYCRRAIEEDAAFAASARWRFRHLFVDEYQDVNAAQLALLKAWCGEEPDLCAVGDPDQAIYAWNGSDPHAIAHFGEDFPGATTIALRANYRSTGEVVSVAGAILGSGRDPLLKGSTPEGPVPTVRAYEDDAAEAAGVAELARLAHRPGRRWSQIAVLARTNAQLSAFRTAFEARQVPYRALGDYLFLRKGAVAEALSSLSRAPNAAALSAIAADMKAAVGADEEDAEGADPADGAGLGELAEMVDDYLRTDVVATGAGFRSFLETTLRAGDARDGSDAVDIATFHRSKGLEWPVVFVTGLEEGFVPIAHARDEEAEAEERRLLYVACTRAREELHCSWARSRSFSPARSVDREPSPYLAAIERARGHLLASRGQSAATARKALAASRRALGTEPVTDSE